MGSGGGLCIKLDIILDNKYLSGARPKTQKSGQILFKDSKFQKLCNFQKVNNSKIQKSLYYMLMIVQTRRSTSLIFAKFEFLKRVN